MYNYLDYRHFRHQVRHKFITDMHKKTTIEDIGESLDDLIFESKARVGEYYKGSVHMFEEP